MAKSRATFNKKNNELKKQKKRQDKEDKKAERKLNTVKGKDLDAMMAYIDENGNISNIPPGPGKEEK